MKVRKIKLIIMYLMLFAVAWFHSEEAHAAESNQARVLAASLTVRSDADLYSSVLGSLKKNAIVSVSQESYGWVKITSGRTTGWVAGYYLEMLSPGEKPNTTGSNRSSKPVKTASSGSLSGKVIVVDPGHGGVDSGSIGKKYGTYEKTLNLSTARYLKEKLQQSGAQVIMTRTDDDDNPELSKRVRISEAQKADAFVSVHYNASPKPVSGTLTFFYSKSKDMALANKIEAQLRQSLDLKSNGISHGDYHVLRENSRPSALVELGFLTNAKDESIVRSANYQMQAAEAIVDGLRDYFKE